MFQNYFKCNKGLKRQEFPQRDKIYSSLLFQLPSEWFEAIDKGEFATSYSFVNNFKMEYPPQ